MPRGRKRPARSRPRVEPDTASHEPVRPTKKRRPPPSPRQTAERRRRRVRESASSRSSSSDWSSSRERRESKRRREIAERARARPSTTETPKQKTEAGKSKKKRRRDSEKPSPAGTAEPRGETPENEVAVPLPLPENSRATDLPATTSADPEPVPSSDPPEDDPSETTVPCCIPRCTWRGPDDALPDHVDGEHAGMVLSGSIQQLQVPVADTERGAALSRVVRAFGELFAVHIRRPPKGTTVLGCVQLLGPPERASDFIYQMEVRDETGQMADPLLQHSPLVANMSSSQEFEIGETLKEVCSADQTNADLNNEATWGNREAITIEVEINTTDYYDPDEEAARSSPPPELSFMWM